MSCIFFCREHFSFAPSFLTLPRAFFFYCDLVLFFFMSIFLLSWAFFFCRELFFCCDLFLFCREHFSFTAGLFTFAESFTVFPWHLWVTAVYRKKQIWRSWWKKRNKQSRKGRSEIERCSNWVGTWPCKYTWITVDTTNAPHYGLDKKKWICSKDYSEAFDKIHKTSGLISCSMLYHQFLTSLSVKPSV